MNPQDQAIKQACRFVLSRPISPPSSDTLARLARHAECENSIDLYGDGGAVGRLERAATERLGKDAGLFFIKGVTAQLCVLRAYAEARSCRNVVIHPLSHMDVDEAGAIERVAGLKAVRLGRFGPFTTVMLDAVTEPLAAVVAELPLRRAGFVLPELEELLAISSWCKERSIPLHFDGARLWEAAAGYGVSEAELAALADSVYVSFYKGLGGDLAAPWSQAPRDLSIHCACGKPVMAVIFLPPTRKPSRRWMASKLWRPAYRSWSSGRVPWHPL